MQGAIGPFPAGRLRGPGQYTPQGGRTLNTIIYPEFYTTPPDYLSVRRAIFQLKGRFDGLRVFPIGRSVLGREIFALSLGEPRNATLYVGGTHGLEWLSILVLLRFLEEILQLQEERGLLCDLDVARVLESRSLLVVPCLNPDGTEIAIHGFGDSSDLLEGIPPEIAATCPGDPTLLWQANARGIDLNHNFDAGFAQVKELERAAGYLGPGPTKYGGEQPLSEPETRAVAGLCRELFPRQLYAFHSQGEEIYYRYGKNTPACSQLMAQVLASTCGYKVTSPGGTASHGGLKDWFIQEFGRPGFTVELGRGKNPLPIGDFPALYEQVRELLMLGVLL